MTKRHALAVLLAVSISPSLALAHAVVFPKKSAPGAYEKYVLRVPNEKGIATTRVELKFPSALRVVSFGDVAGWQLQELRDSSNAIVGAVWTGSLPPERFIEFPFVAVNPKESTSVSWIAYQTYADGEKVDWAGAPDSEKPASVTEIANADAPADRRNTAAWIPLAAVVISLISLGLALRRTA